jgi:hypothetical protein
VTNRHQFLYLPIKIFTFKEFRVGPLQKKQEKHLCKEQQSEVGKSLETVLSKHCAFDSSLCFEKTDFFIF